MESYRRTRLPGKIDSNTRSAVVPLSFGDCILWLDATQIAGLSDNDDLTTWSDLSGNSLDITETTNKPKYRTSAINNYPAVEFGINSSTKLASTGTPTVSAFTLFVVWLEGETRAVNYPVLFQQNDINTGIAHFLYSDDLYFRNAGTGYTEIYTGFTLDGNNVVGTHCSCFRHDEKILAWVDDDVYASGLVYTAPEQSKIITVGNQTISGNQFVGYIGEIIWYSKVLTISEVVLVTDYLNKKWNFL